MAKPMSRAPNRVLVARCSSEIVTDRAGVWPLSFSFMIYPSSSVFAPARRFVAGLAGSVALGLRASASLSARPLLAGALVAGALSPLTLPLALAAPNLDKYVLGPGDVLSVTVQNYAEFDQNSIIIPPDGVVTLPNYGTLRLTGKTRAQVQSEMTAALKKNAKMRRPVVAVAITTFRSGVMGNVVLSGDVPKPGSVELREGGRLSDLLANAGLQTRLEEKRGTLLRAGQSIALDLQSAVRQPRGPADLALRPGDVIAVRQIAPGRITIRGAVARAGIYELHRNPGASGATMELELRPRLSDLITAAGGLQASATSQGNAVQDAMDAIAAGGSLSGAANTLANGTFKTSYTASLQRGGARQTLDPEAALANIDGPANIALLPGDFVTIQTLQPITVYIDGLAARTGSFQVPPGTGLLELLTTAGGLTAAPGETVGTLRRGTQTLPLDLSALLLSSDSASNLTLQNGDIVQLRAPETIAVRVAGAVTKPGELQLKPGATLLDALLGAGGFSVKAEDARLNVLRKQTDGSQTVMNADAAGISSLRDISTNYALREGDVINVTPVQTQTVFVSGQVNNPGPYQLRQGEGLAELITRAGGAKDDALLSGVKVVRAGEQIQTDSYDAVKLGKPLDFDLADGDFVVVPENRARILVLEGVAKPGYYPIPERGTLTLLDAVAQAQPLQNTKKVELLRAREDGTVDRDIKPRVIQLDDVRSGKEGNIVLQARDIIYVPSPKGPKRGFFDYLPIIGAARLFF